MRKFFLAALFAAVLVSGCTSGSTGQPQQDADKSGTGDGTQIVDNKSVYRIYYTDSGFQPSDVTMQKGEKVVWINNVSSEMWIGSDMHPTHTQHDGTSVSEHCRYPRNSEQQERIGDPFDSCASVDRFSYTFNRTGEWGYHNHRFASHGGTVTVTG